MFDSQGLDYLVNCIDTRYSSKIMFLITETSGKQIICIVNTCAELILSPLINIKPKSVTQLIIITSRFKKNNQFGKYTSQISMNRDQYFIRSQKFEK